MATRRTVEPARTKAKPAASIRKESAGKKPNSKKSAESPGDEAMTIVFVHGIGNKPSASVLKCQWDHALMGFDLGERSRLAYWVNREFYPEPATDECRDGDLSPKAARDFSGVHVSKRLEREPLGDVVDEIATTAESKKMLTKLSLKIEAASEADQIRQQAKAIAGVSGKVLPLPAFLRRWITRQVTKAFLRDVNDYFFVPARRKVMRESLLERLRVGGGPFVIIGHSQGSMIAYDVLSSAAAAQLDVRLLLTIGSPLGIAEVKDQLKKITGQKKLTVPACVERWVNVADTLDAVALDSRIANDYVKSASGVVVEDSRVDNPESPRHPHSSSGYLRTEIVRTVVNDAIDKAAFQPVADFVIARDASREMEGAPATSRHELLIEIASLDNSAFPDAPSLRDHIVRTVRACAPQGDTAELNIELLKRYVAVSLTREEATKVANTLGSPKLAKSIGHIWLNARKFALLNESIQTVQCAPAHSAYAARGQGVTWAVLDSGINGAHPHFRNGAIKSQFDCTRTIGEVKELAIASNSDENGHGTHVAGIITGSSTVRNRKSVEIVLSGMAPKSKVISYRVLDRDGTGKDSWIIKALDHIADTNDKAGKLVIHGINLSLGGPFDQSTFGCGHTPLCAELRRLWNQGVVVVIAAGNEGFARLVSDEGEIGSNIDLSICDPANLDEAIAVGSVHKGKPHTYGVSYFSSRGPTADGRQKPDLVAPGEQILSCRHRPLGAGKSLEELYLEMSGTSMAAPHVSGVLAAFLAARKEFIGYPTRVKEILLENCTDLKRDRCHQGAGLPNLVRMLIAT